MADTAVKTYDATKVTIIFGGVPITGYADGSFVKVTPAAERFVKKVGADGEIGRGKSADRTSRVTLTLLQSSPSNAGPSIIETADELLGTGVLPLQIVDLSGNSLHFWTEAWIVKPADVDYATDIGTREWLFDTGQAQSELVAGN